MTRKCEIGCEIAKFIMLVGTFWSHVKHFDFQRDFYIIICTAITAIIYCNTSSRYFIFFPFYLFGHMLKFDFST